MIQRIQSVYLLLSAVMYVLLFVLPVYTLVSDTPQLTTEMYVHQIVTYDDTDQAITQKTTEWVPLLITAALILLSLVTLFLYKNRILQIKLVRFMMLLGSALVVVMIFTKDKADQLIPTPDDVIYTYAIGFLIAPLLLYFLANRAIFKDERLVRSADRLR